MAMFPTTHTTAPKPRPADDTLQFGRVFSDHMFMMEYDEDRGWHDGRVMPYGPLTMDPACCVLHYAQAVFDGLKAFRGADGACGCSGWTSMRRGSIAPASSFASRLSI